MHEYSIVRALVTRVAEEAAKHRGAVVHRLTVRIGDLSGVHVDLLETAFETFSQDTLCQGAELVVERVPVRWTCPGCSAEIPAGAALRCGGCGQPARLVEGNELHLDRIEMEVPDV